MNIPVNEYQTPLTEELLDSLNDEVREQLLDFINNVEFIKNLISPDRKYARDLPRDEKGRIIVDLCNPHILEDMEYFRPTGNCFKEHGKVTLLKPNGNPKSEFGRWFGEEIRRCWEGYVRESDGEWVTGFEYFYLNYEPIIQIKQIGKKKQASRIVDFPKVWEGVHLVFHYLEQARHGGKYDNFEGGKHAVEIARRGASKSYIVAGILACIFLVGENRDACRETRGIVTAYDREKLIKDGTLNKFSSILDFCAEHTQFPYQRLQDSLDKMTWKLGYKDLNTNAEMGLKNVTLGVTAKDNVEKSRGKRSQFFGYEEFGAFKKFIDTWNVNLPSVQEGDIAFGLAFAIGTGGSEGNDFSGALEIIYNPMGYNVYALPNVFDKVNSAKQMTVFFFGAYLNLAGHYNEDGVSDVTGALIQILNNRHRIKYNSSDPMSLTRAKAENPITIQEAIMKRDSTMYPIADLTDRLNAIDSDSHFYDNVYVGGLGMDNDYPFPKTGPEYESVRLFPHKNNKLTGAIEFYKMPERDSNGNILSGRYIAGCLTPGELVLTGEGVKRVEDVTLSDTLINEDGKIVPVKRLLRYDVTNEDTYRIRVSNTLRATNFTKEHPILVSKGKRGYISYKKCKREGVSQRYYKFDFSYKKADKVEKGDWIKVPNIYKNSMEINLDKYWNEDSCRIDRRSSNPLSNPDFWWFIGVWLGDGWCESNGYKISIVFNSKETEYIDRFKSFVESVFNRSISLRERTGSVELSFSYQYLSEFLTKNFGKYTDGKCIPEWAKYIPEEYKKSLIQGYIDSDGCISETSNGYYTYFTSINLPLLEGVQDILFSLGVVSGVKVLREAGSREIVKGTISTTKECYELSIAYHHTVKLCSMFSDGLFRDHKMEKVDPLKYNKRRRPEGDCFFSPNEDYIYFQIKDIEKGSYTGIVYNFECETHTFMCPHITTHNCDPYDDDQSDSLSLGSIIVLDTFTDCIVCEYTGRPDFADDFYEKCRRILLFYNARANYENNKKGLFKYFSQTNSLYLLADTLDFLKERDDSSKFTNNKSKGTQSTAPVKAYARRCIKDWLNKPVLIPNEDPEKEDITIKQLNKIQGRALICELIGWNEDGNFDRHDALGMCMLYREEILRLSGGDPEGSSSASDPSDKAHDDFFERNYKKAMERKSNLR